MATPIFNPDDFVFTKLEVPEDNPTLIEYDAKNPQLQRFILGNTLEALVGAFYLDKGYIKTRKFVVDKLIHPYFNLETIISSETNFKSKLIEWCQRQGKSVRFEMMEMKRNKSQKEFTAQVMMELAALFRRSMRSSKLFRYSILMRLS